MASGPCLAHCYCKPYVAGLAYVALAYTVASVLYAVAAVSLATPFRDSLTTDQARLRRDDQWARVRVFGASLGVAMLALGVLRPLRYAGAT